jgi:hypothetical protein
MNDGLEFILNGIDIKFHPIAVIFNKAIIAVKS